jgi:hypothetical protein
MKRKNNSQNLVHQSGFGRVPKKHEGAAQGVALGEWWGPSSVPRWQVPRERRFSRHWARPSVLIPEPSRTSGGSRYTSPDSVRSRGGQVISTLPGCPGEERGTKPVSRLQA